MNAYRIESHRRDRLGSPGEGLHRLAALRVPHIHGMPTCRKALPLIMVVYAQERMLADKLRLRRDVSLHVAMLKGRLRHSPDFDGTVSGA